VEEGQKWEGILTGKLKESKTNESREHERIVEPYYRDNEDREKKKS